MRKLLLLVTVLILISMASMAQVAINTDGSLPDNSAMLDVKSTTKGLLPPRMTTAQRTAITTPAEGLLVYDTSPGIYYYYHSGAWTALAGGAAGWLLGGNSGTNPVTNFIGTTDNQALKFRVFNQQAGVIDNTKKNTFFGYQSGNGNSTGSSNTAIGQSALFSNISGAFNTAAGTAALYSNTSGSHMVAIGDSALFHQSVNSSGYYDNIAVAPACADL